MLATDRALIWYLEIPNWGLYCIVLYCNSQVCDIPGNIELDGTRVTITAPNHCLLLCDLHIGMTIEGQLNVDGEYKFFDQDGKAIITSEDVAFWAGKMV